MSLFKKIGILFSLYCLLLCNVWADPAKGSPAEAKAMAEKAVAHVKAVGTDKAFQDFMNDPKWKDRDMYVYAGDFSGRMLSHGTNKALVGKEWMDLKDANGFELTKGLINVAKNKGSGWVDYVWANPLTKKSDAKTTFVIQIPGFDGYVAVGAYK